MAFYDNEGTNIYYEIEGNGPDLIMIHGFASNIENNWKRPRVTHALCDNNRLILMDCRGHGKSDKPGKADQYGEKLLDDIVGLLDHLSIEKANFLGYSMGAKLAFQLLLHQPQLVKSAILGGVGLDYVLNSENIIRGNRIVSALKASSIHEIDSKNGKRFRMLAESTGANRKALVSLIEATTAAAVIGGNTGEISEKLKKISIPVMTVNGSYDFISNDKTALASLIPSACHFEIQGRHHMNLVPDMKFKMVVRAFLEMVNGGETHGF